MCQPVLTKQDFVERYYKGEFGNRAPTWDSLDTFWWGPAYQGRLFHLRNRVAGGPTYYRLPGAECWLRWRAMADPAMWYVSEMAPDRHNLLQGEVMEGGTLGVLGLCLTYDTTPGLTMREALPRARTATGILADCLLRANLCPNSLAWLRVLLERYPNHVVEFSSYGVEWGTLPGYNTVFWEVRKY